MILQIGRVGGRARITLANTFTGVFITRIIFVFSSNVTTNTMLNSKGKRGQGPIFGYGGILDIGALYGDGLMA